MKKYFLTGFSGFVSYYFLAYLESLQQPLLVKGVDITPPQFDLSAFKYIKCEFEQVNLLAAERLGAIIKSFSPDYLLHLASYSSVAASWTNPVESFVNNTNIFLNIVEIIRKNQLDCRILSIGSSEEYGNVGPNSLPLKEEERLSPLSPYAVARVAQELLSALYASGYQLDIVMTRSFNHIGPRQKEQFLVASLAKQIIAIKKQQQGNKIIVGDISIIRDFSDVRDVVVAYYQLLQKGRQGEIYNICSGRGRTIKEIIEKMVKLAGIKVEIVTDPARIRPNDNKVIIGSNDKIYQELGWQPQYSLEQSLADILDYWDKNS